MADNGEVEPPISRDPYIDFTDSIPVQLYTLYGDSFKTGKYIMKQLVLHLVLVAVYVYTLGCNDLYSACFIRAFTCT
jgi:hypothetical protein